MHSMRRALWINLASVPPVQTSIRNSEVVCLSQARRLGKQFQHGCKLPIWAKGARRSSLQSRSDSALGRLPRVPAFPHGAP